MAFGFTLKLENTANSSQAPALLQCLEVALQNWGKYITGAGTLDVLLKIEEVPNNRANGGSGYAMWADNSHSLVMGGPQYELMTGSDGNGSTHDIVITVDPDYIADVLSLTPGQLQQGKTDAVSVMMHEIGHAFGFGGYTGNNGILGSTFAKFDTLIAKGEDGKYYFIGPTAVSVFGGAVPITTTGESTASFSHIGNVGDGDLLYDLMNGIVFHHNKQYDVSELDLAILQDIGMPMSQGTSKSDNIVGSVAGDVIATFEGNDSVTGGLGADTIFGNQGLDLLFGNEGNDVIYGGQDADTIIGGQGNDLVVGNLGNDVLYGNMGQDTIFGGQGDDVIFGGQGNDIIYGGAGNDLLFGNASADLFVFEVNSGADVIQGFLFAEGDHLDLQGQSFTQDTASNGSVLLSLSGGGTITLTGVTTFSADFVV